MVKVTFALTVLSKPSNYPGHVISLFVRTITATVSVIVVVAVGFSNCVIVAVPFNVTICLTATFTEIYILECGSLEIP